MKTPICDMPWTLVVDGRGQGPGSSHGPYVIAAAYGGGPVLPYMCALTVGELTLGYAAAPSMTDPVTREQVKKAYRLMALAPDHALLASFFAGAVIMWEASPSYRGHGELVFNGMRRATELDEFGVPRLTDHLRSVLREYRDRCPLLLQHDRVYSCPPIEAPQLAPGLPESPAPVSSPGSSPGSSPAPAARPVPGYPPASRLGPDALGARLDVRA